MSNNTPTQAGITRVGLLKPIKRGKLTGEKDIHPVPRPFVKWAGGKRQLLDILDDAAPTNYGRYFEPFVGGGAFLFAQKPQKATISDINQELINCYKTIRDDVEALIRSLRTHANDEAYFYATRSKDLSTLTPVQRASRFIYLNKTCFNGLYRKTVVGNLMRHSVGTRTLISSIKITSVLSVNI